MAENAGNFSTAMNTLEHALHDPYFSTHPWEVTPAVVETSTTDENNGGNGGGANSNKEVVESSGSQVECCGEYSGCV